MKRIRGAAGVGGMLLMSGYMTMNAPDAVAIDSSDSSDSGSLVVDATLSSDGDTGADHATVTSTVMSRATALAIASTPATHFDSTSKASS